MIPLLYNINMNLNITFVEELIWSPINIYNYYWSVKIKFEKEGFRIISDT